MRTSTDRTWASVPALAGPRTWQPLHATAAADLLRQTLCDDNRQRVRDSFDAMLASRRAQPVVIPVDSLDAEARELLLTAV